MTGHCEIGGRIKFKFSSVGMSNLDDIPPVPKIEPFEEESFSESSPEPEEQSLTQEPAQIQKRKGGRKPVRKANMSIRSDREV